MAAGPVRLMCFLSPLCRVRRHRWTSKSKCGVGFWVGVWALPFSSALGCCCDRGGWGHGGCHRGGQGCVLPLWHFGGGPAHHHPSHLPQNSPNNISGISNPPGTPRDDGELGGNFLHSFQNDNVSECLPAWGWGDSPQGVPEL